MTYEELIELGDKLGVVGKGLKKEEIACIPSRKINFFLHDKPER
jgi:hypothetical protein